MSKNMIKVNNIREEYRHIESQKCECGGEFDKISQAVFPEQKMDEIKVICKKCKKEKSFYFDISSFFGKNII